MLATLAGTLALVSGLALLLLPLLLPELSRPRDSVWGALVLLLGLELVADAERLRGSPMLAVLAAALLIGRLGQEVGRSRWQQLSSEERLRLASLEHWRTRFDQLAQLLAALLAASTSRLGALAPKPRSGGVTKRWVRPEPAPAAEASGDAAADPSPEAAPDTLEVQDFGEIETLLQQAEADSDTTSPAAGATPGEASAPGEEPEAAPAGETGGAG